ncbi:hypothetical protein K523DRAFT_318081 [Schizophyllum commune Tattone D]|nr:hypothetical protein K523DRAFT_318081 [Schizophyllum commune Tattone D]
MHRCQSWRRALSYFVERMCLMTARRYERLVRTIRQVASSTEVWRGEVGGSATRNSRTEACAMRTRPSVIEMNVESTSPDI